MAGCVGLSVFAVFLPQIAAFFQIHWLFLLASFLSGLFLSVPYASLELVFMELCVKTNISRVLSMVSLSSQIAGAVAGYPVNLFFTRVCSFEWAPVVQASLLCFATGCLWSISRLSLEKEKHE